MTSKSSPYITTELNNHVRTIKFARPNKRNAICEEMYLEIINILNADSNNDDIVATVITGIGEYYCSGNDLTTKLTPNENMEAVLRKSNEMFKNFIAAFIDYPKLLIAVVNGPAIGIAVTTLGLCDIVYASERATFKTPFLQIGLCPEGCSSYLFPRIMGRSKASEMLFLGHTLTAQEALQFGLVSEVIPHGKLQDLFVKLQSYGSLPVQSVKRAKRLVNVHLKEQLHKANELESKELLDCFHSEEFFNGLMNFVNRKRSKL